MEKCVWAVLLKVLCARGFKDSKHLGEFLVSVPPPHSVRLAVKADVCISPCSLLDSYLCM